MLQHTELPTTAITEQPSPMLSPNFYAWGEFLGIILIAGAVLAKDFLAKRDSRSKKQEEEQNELIDVLKAEITKRDESIARLQNELILIRKTMDFSGEFSPPVSKERVLEINQHDNPHLYSRENS